MAGKKEGQVIRKGTSVKRTPGGSNRHARKLEREAYLAERARHRKRLENIENQSKGEEK